jgi:ribosomal protein L10
MKKYAMDFIVNVLEEVKNNPTLSLAKIAENNNLTSGAPLIRWLIKRYNQFNKDIVELRKNMADEKEDAFLTTIENMNHQIEELKNEQNKMRQKHKMEISILRNKLHNRALMNKLDVNSLKKGLRQQLAIEKISSDKKIKQANKELKRLQHDHEGTLAKNEILKKSIPTCQAIEMMKKTSRDILLILRFLD